MKLTTKLLRLVASIYLITVCLSWAIELTCQHFDDGAIWGPGTAIYYAMNVASYIEDVERVFLYLFVFILSSAIYKCTKWIADNGEEVEIITNYFKTKRGEK